MQSMPDLQKLHPTASRAKELLIRFSDSSYRAKSQAMESLRNERLNQIGGIWIARSRQSSRFADWFGSPSESEAVRF